MDYLALDDDEATVKAFTYDIRILFLSLSLTLLYLIDCTYNYL